MKKVSTLTGIVIILAAAIVLFGGAYIYFWYANPKSEDLNSSQIQNSDTETANWKKYKNSEYGFEVKYPANWILKNYTQERDVLIQFIAPNTELLMESNTRACNDKNGATECSADGVPADIVLNISPKSTVSITEPQGTVNFNNTTFTKYLGAFAGEQHFITTHDGKDFDLACTSVNLCNQIISTFKFTPVK